MGDLVRELVLFVAVATGAFQPAIGDDGWWDGCAPEHRLGVPVAYAGRDDGLSSYVEVVGDHGREGYADACYVLGKGERAPGTPAEALRLERARPLMVVPVFASDGVTRIDTFTIQPGVGGGRELASGTPIID